ncbi:MAG: YARHG domain-containing protein [candidate division WS1 bacterium]|nr:YARHG domain-containing protein [candidate division WS1 bacterium]
MKWAIGIAAAFAMIVLVGIAVFVGMRIGRSGDDAAGGDVTATRTEDTSAESTPAGGQGKLTAGAATSETGAATREQPFTSAVEMPDTTPPPPPPVAPPPPVLPVRNELLPQSDDRPLTGSDVTGLGNWDLTLARNEIYARHGRPFSNAQIRAYFQGTGWYTADSGYSDRRLSQLESRNAVFIREYQEAVFGRAATAP